MIPYVRVEDVLGEKVKKTGYTLLDESHGCVNGSTCGISLYRNKNYLKITAHDDQEGFLVLEGRGVAYIDGEELNIEPGMCFMVPAHVEHAMKAAEGCDVCKVFWFHAAV